MKKLLPFILAAFFLSCDRGPLAPEEILIRVENVSEFAFEGIVVNSVGEVITFGDLLPMEVSDYQVVQQAYTYAYIELRIAGETYIIQPIDFIGESLLGSGRYTYQIDATDSTARYGRLALTFVVN